MRFCMVHAFLPRMSSILVYGGQDGNTRLLPEWTAASETLRRVAPTPSSFPLRIAPGLFRVLLLRRLRLPLPPTSRIADVAANLNL